MPIKIQYFSIVYNFAICSSFSILVIPSCSQEQGTSFKLLSKVHESVTVEKRHHIQVIFRIF